MLILRIPLPAPYTGLMLWPFLLVGRGTRISDRFLMHECIHAAQQLEFWPVNLGFWLLLAWAWPPSIYAFPLLGWLWPWILCYGALYLEGRLRGLTHMQAYFANAFESEAYAEEQQPKAWLDERPAFHWLNFIS